MSFQKGITVLAMVLLAAAPAWAQQASNVTAFHRSGQTFVTWQESTVSTNERYRVYRYDTPIAASNLLASDLLYEVPEGSGRFLVNLHDGNWDYVWEPRYVDRYVITNNGSQLAPDTGLLVWTLATNDFGGGSTGQAYYAVTLVDVSGSENTNDVSLSNTTGPLYEGVADPLPVRIPTNIGSRGHVYIQYMDLRSWNPTFHAPHSRNFYYGLTPDHMAVTGAIQYAYDYVVYEPECSNSPSAAYFNLHGYNKEYKPIIFDKDANGWCSYKIFPFDIEETWYFGFARNYDYRKEDRPGTGDQIVNYTEQRLLRMLHDLVRDPPGVAVDTNRIYVWGHSMGASGTLAMSLRYPNVFAAAFAGQPMTDYGTSGDGGGKDWRDDVTWKWGKDTDNLPIISDGPAGWADHLEVYDGTGVWDWQNHQSNLLQRVGDEIVPIGVNAATNDTALEWITQGEPMFPAFDASKRCWGGVVNDVGHSWSGFNAFPVPMMTNNAEEPFWGFSVVRNETVPGLSNGSADNPLPVTAQGEFNRVLDWSASWRNWDAAPVDQSNQWQMSFRSLVGSNVTVDVTPRRLQAFPKAPGTRILWRNIQLVPSNVVQIGQMAADGDGLLTIPSLLVSSNGNRLRIDRDSNVDSDSDGMPDYWEEAFGLNPTNDSDAVGDLDNDGASNKREYDAATHPSNALSIFAITTITTNSLSWQTVAGFDYHVEWTTAISDDQWSTGAVVMTAGEGITTSAVPDSTNAVRFYRIRVD